MGDRFLGRVKAYLGLNVLDFFSVGRWSVKESKPRLPTVFRRNRTRNETAMENKTVTEPKLQPYHTKVGNQAPESARTPFDKERLPKNWVKKEKPSDNRRQTKRPGYRGVIPSLTAALRRKRLLTLTTANMTPHRFKAVFLKNMGAVLKQLRP